MPPRTATKVDASKTKSKAPASAGATNLTGPYDPFASSDPFAEAAAVKTVVPVKTDKIHIREWSYAGVGVWRVGKGEWRIVRTARGGEAVPSRCCCVS